MTTDFERQRFERKIAERNERIAKASGPSAPAVPPASLSPHHCDPTRRRATEAMKRFTMPKVFGNTEFDLAKVNQAMDAIFAAGSESAGRYALMHTHGWEAGDAVDYGRCAMFFIDNVLDPNDRSDLEGLAEIVGEWP